jgi:parallel beta-helix repeat protein
LIGPFSLNFKTEKQPQQAGIIYIRPDGSIDPPTAPIQRINSAKIFTNSLIDSGSVGKGDVYAFTANVMGSIMIERDGVTIDGGGHTIQGVGNITSVSGGTQYVGPPNYSAIELWYKTGITVQNYVINGFSVPIALHKSTHNIIQNITVLQSDYPASILLDNSSYNIIRQNRAKTGNIGVFMNFLSHSNIVSDNIITDCGTGIWILSWNNTISGNMIQRTLEGIYISGPNGDPDHPYIGMNNTIISNNLTQNSGAIELSDSSNNIISKNNLLLNQFGIVGGDQNSYGNIYSENNIQENQIGIQMVYNAAVYRNNFINNSRQVDFASYHNSHSPTPNADIWDNGKEGNYWSDYSVNYPNPEEFGNSGTYNTPYAPYPDNLDNHPLVKPVEVQLGSKDSGTKSWNPEYTLWITITIIAAATVLLFIAFAKKSRNRFRYQTSAR